MTPARRISFTDALAARALQAAYPTLQGLFLDSPELELATQQIAEPTVVTVPTRHGEIDALVHAPTQRDIDAASAQGRRPPVHVITHGGAFIIQYPTEEGNVARYLASEVGCYVVVPDYLAAPQAQHPVAEDQCSDAFQWVHGAADRGWDTERVTVGGPSAGGSLALTVALDAIVADTYRPLAVTTEFGVADVSRGIDQRTSPKRNPVVGPQLMRLVRDTYFKGVDLTDPRASPLLHPRLGELPPTLVLTAGLDTLKHESNDLAARLADLGVVVTHHEYEGVDHGFTHQKPVATARAAMEAMAAHLRRAYAA